MEKENSNKKLSIVLGVVIVVLVAVIGVLAYMLLNPKEAAQQEAASTTADDEGDAETLGYDEGVVVTDENSLQKAYDEMKKKAEEGTMALEMKTEAVSGDGETFTCTLANAAENRYDMYMTIYLDETGEEIYRSGLIPVGMMIGTFKTTKKIGFGEHEATLVYTQIEDDHSTVHSHVNEGLTLKVQ